MAPSFANRLFDCRRLAGISQSQLAEKTGFSRHLISKWERGEAVPDEECLEKLAFAIGVPTMFLSGKEPEVVAEEPPVAEEPEVKAEAVPFPDDELLVEGEEDYACPSEDENQDSEEPQCAARKRRAVWEDAPVAAVITIAFLLIGFLYGGWGIAWTLFLLIPVIHSAMNAIFSRNAKRFAYPALITFVYCFLGMWKGLWHPLWILFLTVPIYYYIASLITNRKKN